ncbi:MAG: phosphoenolpyruvate carboxykinase (GTP) [Candidatus Omnitrophica bacterium]|nr:phosphoenolpyruvate carboxykinase (GTP) [Candidatus Omnitrophota bacterium]
MSENYMELLKQKIDQENLDKLLALKNEEVINFVGEYVELCNPASVFVRTDSEPDRAYIRGKSLSGNEEIPLKTKGHTAHFDGFFDQARDKKNTKYLAVGDRKYTKYVNTVDKDSGLGEVRGYLKDIMQGKEMFVCFFCLGPANSEFSISAVQITDSAYVVHSEDILYRPGYEQFKGVKSEFFHFVHSAGELEAAVSKNVDSRRVYIDLENNTVFSTNTQYAGNTVGLKKLALRLAINKASKEGWLAEHMFVMGVHNDQGEKAYFCGAYPSMCGKTSTAMINGEKIIGDDIAYLRERNGKVYAVNVERGIFGIIKDVNSTDDAVIFNSLTKEGEVIFSNILVDNDGVPFWLGKDAPLPSKGINYSGDWSPGKVDDKGNEITPSHKNARYTISISALDNVDENLENPDGVEIKGLVYGGRDSDTSSPIEQSLSWEHGIITKAAALESETTAATLGKEGVRVFNPMSNIDFLAVGLGKYIDMNLRFKDKLKDAPLIFSANYFLRDSDGKFLNAIEDKRVWLKWMRQRVDKSVKALKTPTGFIPKYEDLAQLFKTVLNKEYKKDDYIEQFSLRIPKIFAKIERILKIYKESEGIPSQLFDELEAQGQRLSQCQKEFGDCVTPQSFKEE